MSETGLVATGSARRHRRGKLSRRRRATGLAFLSPALALLLAIMAIPMGLGLYQSLTNESLVRRGQTKFIGLENYADRVIAPGFASAALVTAIIMVLSLAVQLPIGYWLALCLSRRIGASSVFRTILTLPMMLTPVAVGLMWRFLADPDLGIIRWIASTMDSAAHPNVFGSRVSATILIVVVNSWINIPLVTLLLLAGLLGVPDELYEAAAIDGANRWQTRWHITIPSITPVIAVVCVLRLAGDYCMFDLVYTITHGGPGTSTRNLSMLAYQEGLVNYSIGRATAIAMTMAILALPAYLAFRKVSRA
ncbi:MAG: sugar ABC transporter permease [Micrococcales bacterium]|nr:sugar ABC transporter permease [Micrococcales bacterium]